MDLISADRIVLAIIALLVSVAGYLIRNFAKNWDTRLIAQAKELAEHRVKIAEHENKHARQDEKNTNFEKTVERIEEGIQGINTRLDNVIGSNRASS